MNHVRCLHEGGVPGGRSLLRCGMMGRIAETRRPSSRPERRGWRRWRLMALESNRTGVTLFEARRVGGSKLDFHPSPRVLFAVDR